MIKEIYSVKLDEKNNPIDGLGITKASNKLTYYYLKYFVFSVLFGPLFLVLPPTLSYFLSPKSYALIFGDSLSILPILLQLCFLLIIDSYYAVFITTLIRFSKYKTLQIIVFLNFIILLPIIFFLNPTIGSYWAVPTIISFLFSFIALLIETKDTTIPSKKISIALIPLLIVLNIIILIFVGWGLTSLSLDQILKAKS